LFFLLGILLFFVKSNIPVNRYVLNLSTGEGDLVAVYKSPKGPSVT
jgi:hypothetical protein